MRAQEYLLNIPIWTKKKNTLEDVWAFLEKLGTPQRRFNIIHVAGTNGKGSVCADLSSILKAAGYRVGTFTSPHLVNIRERFLVNGQMIALGDLEDCFCQVMSVVHAMIERGYCHPTFFEFCFLIAMVYFAKQQVDYCILETGLGGRLDTTNAIDSPLACVITSISLDHTQYLGTTIEQIAAEKAGIIKPGVPVIYDDNDDCASFVIEKEAARQKAEAYPVSVQKIPNAFPVIKEVHFPAPYQAMNAALALKTLQVLKVPGVDEAVCRTGLENVSWPGRMEQIEDGIWLDGAHNLGGIGAFAEAVHTQLAAISENPWKIELLFAAVSDKPYDEMIRMLCTQLPLSHVTVVHLKTGRAVDQKQLAQLFLEEGCPSVEQFEKVCDAFAAALNHKKAHHARLYIVGSLYLIGEIKQLFARQENGMGGTV